MTYQAPPPPPQFQPVQPMSPQDEKLWSVLTHLSGLIVSFVGPLIGYLVLKDRGPFVNAHTKTALNFQISFAIYSVAALIITVVTFGIGGILFLPLVVVEVIFMIIAAVKANAGVYYSYPLTIKFIK